MFYLSCLLNHYIAVALLCRIFLSNWVLVDKYMLFLDGEEYKAIFICSYGHDSHYAPCDMLLDK